VTPLRGLGTALNVAAVLAGGTIGLTLGRFIPDRFHQSVRQAIGLFVVVYGITMAVSTRNPLILLISLLLGVTAGEALRLEDGVREVGRWAERRVSRGEPTGRVSIAFVTTSLLFCVGPLAILGTFNDGSRGDITLLAVKSTLDGFSSIVFAATLGWGVLLSAASVLIVQGSLTLAAFLLHASLSTPQVQELTAVGGVMVIAMGVGLLELKSFRVANFLPGLVVAPLIVFALRAFNLF
jgi:uncharacterized protein